MTRINKITILSWSLAFVVIWFGVTEIMHPAEWAVFVPSFVAGVAPAATLVTVHGFLLFVLSLALIFNFYRRVAAIIVAIILLEIIFNFLQKGGLNPIVVRDIGLFGAALALSFRN